MYNLKTPDLFDWISCSRTSISSATWMLCNFLMKIIIKITARREDEAKSIKTTSSVELRKCSTKSSGKEASRNLHRIYILCASSCVIKHHFEIGCILWNFHFFIRFSSLFHSTNSNVWCTRVLVVFCAFSSTTNHLKLSSALSTAFFFNSLRRFSGWIENSFSSQNKETRLGRLEKGRDGNSNYNKYLFFFLCIFSMCKTWGKLFTEKIAIFFLIRSRKYPFYLSSFFTSLFSSFFFTCNNLPNPSYSVSIYWMESAVSVGWE